ncbi:hypothetical protein [Comamonas sp. JC664]|uniref:hypothetical protein n=1 Tax=Comamonas sp. JC664 TaxID=2801917 RepID=UPI001749526A|nr:hypothetical protein [Comamonas sp. JC664]MBL0694475.1 hypothetical protein [Comamonas sp. JC664]GHG77764.1 hypothetical protein GCM10012319_28090 [Comamonas sp. KCTC 72670]
MSTESKDAAAPASRPVRKDVLPFDGTLSETAVEFMAGYGALLFLVAQLLPALDGKALDLKRVALAALAVPVGLYCIAWGRARRLQRKRERAELEASIPKEDWIQGDPLSAVASAMAGDRLSAVRQGFVESVRAPEEQGAPARFDRVQFVRDGVSMVAYESRYASWSATPLNERGPDLAFHIHPYWRVRAEVASTTAFAIHARTPPVTWHLKPQEDPVPATFEATFEIHDTSGWVQGHFPDALRALMLQRPAFYVRCRHGRVECLWPRHVVGVTHSRFEDAAFIVAALVRLLDSQPQARRG